MDLRSAGRASLIAALLFLSGTAHAGNNAGVKAFLSWSPTTQITNTTAAASSDLYVRVSRSEAMEFRGCDIGIHWQPWDDSPVDGAADTGFLYSAYSNPTSDGTTCTYLNRGPAVTLLGNGLNWFYVSWDDTETLTGCTEGCVLLVNFVTDYTEHEGYASPSGILCLDVVKVRDDSGQADIAEILGPEVYINNNIGGYWCGAPVLPSTWGAIKALYESRRP